MINASANPNTSWTSNTINLRTLTVGEGQLNPGNSTATPDQSPQLGVDYIPPLNARAEIISTVRRTSETEALLKEAGLTSFSDIPESFSWNNVNDIAAVKDWKLETPPILPPPSQYACGSCWAWASATMLSDRYAVFTKQANPNLSPTYLLACMNADEKCNGGFPADAGRFLEHNGIPPSDCWNYDWCTNSVQCRNSHTSTTVLNGLIPSCNTVKRKPCASTLFKAQPGSTQALVDQRSIQLDILQNGPVVAVYRVFGDFVIGSSSKNVNPKADGWAKTRGVYVHITGQDIYNYGKMDCLGADEPAPDCFMGNHAVVIVGWGVQDHVLNFIDPKSPPLRLPYWIVRNSWGTAWHEGGYFRIAMSNPDNGINMSVALDRPIRIGNVHFGAVTTWLPAVKNLQTGILRTGQWTVSAGRVRFVINLKVIAYVGLLVASLLAIHWYYQNLALTIQKSSTSTTKLIRRHHRSP